MWVIKPFQRNITHEKYNISYKYMSNNQIDSSQMSENIISEVETELKKLDIETDISDGLHSVFLLMLAVSGNFVGETLGCKTQYHMTNNMVIKQIIIFFMIYFTLIYTSKKDVNPINSLKNAILIWILFLMFTKMNLRFTTISAVLLCILYVTGNYLEYYQNQGKKLKKNQVAEKKKLKEKEQNMKTARHYLLIASGAVLVSGFTFYYFDKRREYGESFNTLKFIFGVENCQSLQ